MKITVIGAGNVGGTLAKGFKKAGHDVCFGVKDVNLPFKGIELAKEEGIPFYNVQQAVAMSEVVVIAAPAQFAHEIAKGLGDVHDKVIIDTMNGVFMRPEGFTNTSDAILANCNCIDVVKCFNTTGYENMENPVYQGKGIDLFMSGSSEKGKDIAKQLGKDLGFGEVHDFGGNDKFFLQEQLAFAWINLAILQKQGRDLALTITRR